MLRDGAFAADPSQLERRQIVSDSNAARVVDGSRSCKVVSPFASRIDVILARWCETASKELKCLRQGGAREPSHRAVHCIRHAKRRIPVA